MIDEHNTTVVVDSCPLVLNGIYGHKNGSLTRYELVRIIADSCIISDVTDRREIQVFTDSFKQNYVYYSGLHASINSVVSENNNCGGAVENNNLRKFDSGATRSKDADNVRYDLISHVGLRRLAETYAEGAEKYGDNNWQKGFPISSCLNHAIRHIELYKSGDKSEDHLAHAAWNLFAMMHFEELLPEMQDIRERLDK